jgi:acetyltransferase-like isoleucine patch superfamily enzyme
MSLTRLYQIGLLPLLVLVLVAYKLKLCSFISASRFLALMPGEAAVWLREKWYKRTLARCGQSLYVDWMGAIKTPKATVGNRVFIGTFCWIGWAEIGDDVMLGGHIVILSGSQHHAFDRTDIPMTQQPGKLTQIKIGNDVWVGNGAIIMADVSTGSVVAAGSVVTRTFEPYSIIAGVPAKVIGSRDLKEGTILKDKADDTSAS